jgi:hypothetical protein
MCSYIEANIYYDLENTLLIVSEDHAYCFPGRRANDGRIDTGCYDIAARISGHYVILK